MNETLEGSFEAEGGNLSIKAQGRRPAIYTYVQQWMFTGDAFTRGGDEVTWYVIIRIVEADIRDCCHIVLRLIQSHLVQQ